MKLDGIAVPAPVDRGSLASLIRTLWDLRRRGEMAEIFKRIAPDIVVHSQGIGRLTPFGDPVYGREAVEERFRQLYVKYEILGTELHEIVVDGERAAVRRTSKIRNRGSGRPLSLDIVDFLQFRDGQIVEFREFSYYASSPRAFDAG